MLTVKKVSELTGVSVRTLQYYDKIGLLVPNARTEAGYRLYGDSELETLQQILLFREIGFPLAEIKRILGSPDYDRKKALAQQIELLELKKQHIENLIMLARGVKLIGVRAVDFSAFDKSRLDEYAERARREWGDTPQYKELAEKERDRTPEETQRLTEELMTIFAELGTMKNTSPASEAVQSKIKQIQDFITANLYTCSDRILAGLGRMYAGGGEISDSIDLVGGKGTADLAARAIEIYCAGRLDT